MLTYNDKISKFEADLKISEYTKSEHSATTMNCRVSEKMNIELDYSFS